MKKKNGFTLIELLVVIALMLSILGIAVVSLINASNKKKEEAWQQVKAQIETAAVEYFTANEYLFEGLSTYDGISSDASASGYITVGALVKEDYLNKVTNPVTGNAVSYCTKVNVTKKARKLTATYDETLDSSGEDESRCNDTHMISVSEPGAPDFEIENVCKKKNGVPTSPQNGYCYTNTFKVINIKTNGVISSKQYCVASASTCSVSTDFSVSFDGVSDTTDNGIAGITLANQSGAKTTKYIGYKIDREAPIITEASITSENSNYNTLRPNISVKASDRKSGIYKIATSANGDKKPTYSTSFSYHFTIARDYDTIHNLGVTAVAYDNLGNESIPTEKSYDTYLKCSAKNETSSTSWHNNCSAACGGGTETGTETTYYSDKYLSGVSCGNDGGKTVSRTCNTQDCCSKTKVGSYNYSNWSACSKACGGGNQTRTRTPNLVSAYNGQSCGQGNTETERQDCNTQDCCSSTYSDGYEYGAWSSCNASCSSTGTQTRTKKPKLFSNYDGRSCGLGASSNETQTCTNTDPCTATSCSTAKVYSSNKDCTSSAGNDITARLKIKCNGKIDYVSVKYYYPGAQFSVCNGNSASRAVCKHYPGGSTNCSDTQKASSNKNGAVFNFRGCGVTTVTYKYKVVAGGKTIHKYDDDDWKTYNFTTSNNASKLCSPEKGSYWFD